MVKKKLISIIIRGKNEARWLKILLRELKKQTIKNYEIIFCDNNSTDETSEILKKFKIKKIIKFDKYFPGEILNRAIKVSNSQYICILSAHCIPADKNWLKQHLYSINLDKKICATYGKQLPLPGTSVQNLIDLDIIFKDQPITYKNDPYLNNANAFYKSEILKKNLFNPKLTNIEDRIWAKNITKKGFKIYYSASAGVFHLHGVHQHNSKSTRAQNTYKILVKKYKKYWAKCNFIKKEYFKYALIINGRRMKIKIVQNQKLIKLFSNIKKLKLNFDKIYLINNFKFNTQKNKMINIRSHNTLKKDLVSIYKNNIKSLTDINYIVYLNLNENFNLKNIEKIIKECVYFQYDSATFGEIIKENFIVNFKGQEKLKSIDLDTIENKPEITLLKWSKGTLFQVDNLRKGILFSDSTKIFF